MVDICHHIFVQSHIMYRPRMNPNVNYELEVMMISQCRFVLAKKRHHSDVTHVWRQDI